MSREEGNLLDILKAARLAIEFKDDVEKAEFLTDLKAQSAVLHELLIIGEAVKRLSADFRAARPEVAMCPLLAGAGKSHSQLTLCRLISINSAAR